MRIADLVQDMHQECGLHSELYLKEGPFIKHLGGQLTLCCHHCVGACRSSAFNSQCSPRLVRQPNAALILGGSSGCYCDTYINNGSQVRMAMLWLHKVQS